MCCIGVGRWKGGRVVELVWDGKYGPDEQKARPVRLALPFQEVETVNESAQTRTRMLDLFACNQPGEWRNRLIWGDKKYVLPALLPEFAGKVDLIYIDPPFATGADFSFTATIPDDSTTDGDQGGTFLKQPSMIRWVRLSPQLALARLVMDRYQSQ